MSQCHLEHRKQLERELRNAGIKPEVIRTEGGHMRIMWDAGGKKQFILTSWTPSDHRSTLNARACIRRILRNTGMLDKAMPSGKLGKALSVPHQTEPFMDRIAQLEADVAMLLDMLATVAEHAGVDLEPPPPPPEPVIVAVEAKPAPSQPTLAGLLQSMAFTWMSTDEITRRDGRSKTAVNGALAYLKKKGLVENGARAMWRRVAGTALQEKKRVYVAPTHGPSRSKVHDLLLSMEYDWLPFTEIARREAGRSRGALSVALDKLKKKGLVENGVRGMWRKTAPKQPNGHPHANRAVHAAAAV